MRGYLSALLFMAVAAAVCLSAGYGLGLWGGEATEYVTRRSYDHDGFLFTGTLTDGKFSGEGELLFSDGSRYEGAFTDGRFDGAGVFTFADRFRYEGFFENGRATDGVFYLTENEETVTYRQDNATGIVRSEQGGWLYDGGFGEFGQTGLGRFMFPDGSVYEGRFARGLADGEGTYISPDSIILYQGGFKQGRFDGEGVYNSPEGWSYRGAFKAGLFDGAGVLTDNGKTITGVWKEGTRTI